jgi:hypothetical protein
MPLNELSEARDIASALNWAIATAIPWIPEKERILMTVVSSRGTSDVESLWSKHTL